jgi:hypothetical protein
MVLKLGPARQIDPRLESGRVEEKIEKEKTRCDPVDRARSSQKPGCNLLTFIFFLFFTKMTSF